MTPDGLHTDYPAHSSVGCPSAYATRHR